MMEHRIDVITLAVGDLERAFAFYREDVCSVGAPRFSSSLPA